MGSNRIELYLTDPRGDKIKSLYPNYSINDIVKRCGRFTIQNGSNPRLFYRPAENVDSKIMHVETLTIARIYPEYTLIVHVNGQIIPSICLKQLHKLLQYRASTPKLKELYRRLSTYKQEIEIMCD